MNQPTTITLTPIPTRRRAVLTFQQPTTLFINREIIENDSFENDRGATNGWEVTRRIVSSVSCHRIATSITYKRRFLLRFFSRDGTTVKFDCSLHAPDTWYPRTVLMTLDAQMHFRNHLGNPVISIIDSSQGIDICGLLRPCPFTFCKHIKP